MDYNLLAKVVIICAGFATSAYTRDAGYVVVALIAAIFI